MLDKIQKVEIKGLNFAEIPENYAKFLACGFDTIQESFDVTVLPEFAEVFYSLKRQAEDYNNPVSIPTIFKLQTNLQMMPTAASGFTYRLSNDDYQVLIRNPAGKQKDWQVSVRYTAAGLWEYGYERLNEEVLSFISRFCGKPNSRDWQHVTRADFCFDFYSPAFDDEMNYKIMDGIVATSNTKVSINTKIDLNAFAKAGKIETFTIGNKGSLQIAVYDKTKEIKESSGKTWFYKIWGNEYQNSVYRVEIRMSKNWLKDRNIRSMDKLKENLPELLNDALRVRRLAIPGRDSNRSRWRIHPLWGLCFDVIGNPVEIVKIGRYVTQRKEYLEKGLCKQIAGCIRSLVVLKANKWDEEIYIGTMRDVITDLFDDPQKNLKIKQAQERYKFVNEAV